MKKLNVYTRLAIFTNITNEFRNNDEFYIKSEADKVIAKKDKEIARLDDLAHAHNIELLRKENLIEELKDKLRHYPMLVAMLESDKLEISNDKHKIRKLKRALYKACVNWMTNRQCAMKCFDLEARAKKFDKAIAKCRAKAEEYKLAEKFKEAK